MIVDSIRNDKALMAELRFWVTNQEVAVKVVENTGSLGRVMLERMENKQAK
jgi:hypothetical protein